MKVSEVIFLIIAIAFLGIAIIAFIVEFIKLPKENRISALKEWLYFAVVEAEKIYKGGTGQLKLHYVYNLAIEKFPWVATLITFATFSSWVDDALIWMRTQLTSNQNVKDYVEDKTDGIQ